MEVQHVAESSHLAFVASLKEARCTCCAREGNKLLCPQTWVLLSSSYSLTRSYGKRHSLLEKKGNRVCTWMTECLIVQWGCRTNKRSLKQRALWSWALEHCGKSCIIRQSLKKPGQRKGKSPTRAADRAEDIGEERHRWDNRWILAHLAHPTLHLVA